MSRPCFDRELFYAEFIKKHLGTRNETDRVPGYTYTFLEFKKLLFDSPLEYTRDGGLVFSMLGLSFTLDDMTHSEWDDPSYTKNEPF